MDEPAEALPPESPIELHGRRARSALSDAAIWLGLAAAIWLAWQLSQPLLVILAGIIFAAGLQGATEWLGGKLRWPHWLRLTLVVLLFFAVLAGFVAFAGVSIATQFGELAETIQRQSTELAGFAKEYGLTIGEGDPMTALKAQLGSSLGRIASFVGSAAGALGALLLIVLLGIFFAADPRGYERGVEWLTPAGHRDAVRETTSEIAHMLRRWVLGRLAIMVVEGVMIFVGLSLVGVPLAGALGLISGLLAFIPNIGALVSGILIVLVGLSGGLESGLAAFAVYLVVQASDNFISPLIEKKAIDIAPAVVLAAQLLFGTLFGIMGVALADPIVAMAKVALQRGEVRPASPPADERRT